MEFALTVVYKRNLSMFGGQSDTMWKFHHFQTKLFHQ